MSDVLVESNACRTVALNCEQDAVKLCQKVVPCPVKILPRRKGDASWSWQLTST